MLKVFIILNILSLQVYGQTPQDFYDEIDVDLGALELSSTGIEKLENTLPDIPQERVFVKEHRFNWETNSLNKMLNYEPIYAQVLPGTKLYKLADDQFVTIRRRITVKVLRGFDQQKQTYILNKNGEAKYKVAFDKVVPIREVIRIHEEPRTYTEYTPRKEKKYDTTLIFHEVSFIGLSKTTNFLANTLLIDSDPILSTGLQYQVLFDFDFPIIIGLESVYHAGTSDTSAGDIDVSQFAIGPIINFQIGTFSNRKVFAEIGSLFSLLYEAQPADGGSVTNFRSQLLSAGVKFYSPATFADFVFGLKYNWEFINPTSTDLENSIDDSTFKDNSIVFTGGLSW